MQSYWMQTNTGQAAIGIRDMPLPEPGPHQVLVRLHAAGLNRGEFIAGHGLHAASGAAKAIGMEGAGEIVKLGAGVTHLQPGQRVLGRCPGAFAEYGLMDARETILAPANLSWEEAAAIPLTFLVVYDMLVTQGRLASGEWMLVTGVSSGVGVAALQTAKALGASVIGTSRSEDKLARLAGHGLDLGLAAGTGLHEAVLQATDGRGADLAVNTVGGSLFPACMRALAYEGRLATVGHVDGVLHSDIDIEAMHSKRLTLFGVSNKFRGIEQRAATAAGFSSDILPKIAAGQITPLIDRVYPFAQLAEAKAHMEADRHVGKIVLTMP
ncbi:MAG: zinc-binding dehydrogenase [Pseudomonadota bacterium]